MRFAAVVAAASVGMLVAPGLFLPGAPPAKAHDGSMGFVTARLPSERQFTAAVWTGSGAYVFGGNAFNDPWPFSDQILRYDPAADTLTVTGAHLPSGREFPSAVWDGQHAYVFGGQGGGAGSQIVRFDPAAGTAELVLNAPTTMDRTSAVWDPRDRPGTGCADGCAYVFGAGQGRGVVRYNPATNSASVMGVTLPVRGHTSAVWDGQHAYLFGAEMEPPGDGGSGGSCERGNDDIVRYDPVADSAQVVAYLPSPRTFTAAAWSGTYAYVAGGYSCAGPGQYPDIVRFSPASLEVVTRSPSLPQRTNGASAAFTGSHVLVFGGLSFWDRIARFVPEDRPPAASIAPTAPAECADGIGSVALDGTASADPDGDGLAYAWTAAGASFAGGADGATAVAVAPVGQAEATLTVHSTVHPASEDSATAPVIVVDTLPPSSTAALAGVAGNGGWWRSAVEVSWTVEDLCGPVGLHYRLDGGPEQEGTAATVSGDGLHTVDYQAVDGAGNEEALRRLDLAIDETAPQTTAALQGTAGEAGWWRSDVEVALLAEDATSGVAATWRAVDGGPWEIASSAMLAGDGPHAVRFRSEDLAGNGEPERRVDPWIDATPPVTVAALQGPAGENGWWRSPVDVTLSAHDDTSGLKATYLSVDGRPWRAATAARLTAEGVHTVDFYSRDEAGNAEPVQRVTVSIDTTAPQVGLLEPERGRAYLNDEPLPLPLPTLPVTMVAGDKTVKAAATDAASGVARVEFSVDGVLRATDPEAPYEFLWTAGAEALGYHEVEARAFDASGLMSAEARTVLVVPTTAEGLLASGP